jgi:hypothetical protein
MASDFSPWVFNFYLEHAASIKINYDVLFKDTKCSALLKISPAHAASIKINYDVLFKDAKCALLKISPAHKNLGREKPTGTVS